MQALGLVWNPFDPLMGHLRETVLPIPSPVHLGSKLLHELWSELQKKGGLVVGRDVPSRHVSEILRNLAIFEPVDCANDFRARLVGTGFMRRFGKDVTGLRLSQIFCEAGFERHRNVMAETVRSGEPSAFDVKLRRGNRTVLHCEILKLPVFSPDRRSTWILKGLFYHD
jgi:hypothetical protein